MYNSYLRQLLNGLCTRCKGNYIACCTFPREAAIYDDGMTLGTLYTLLTARPVKGAVPFSLFVIACCSEYLETRLGALWVCPKPTMGPPQSNILLELFNLSGL